MNYQVDPQFVIRTTNLAREILSDEASYVSRNNQNFQILHNKIFSKVDQTRFQDLQPTQKTFFNKYFYINGAVGSPRLDVPFANSTEDQAFFFDQFRNQVKNLTYNYERMDFVRPRFPDDKTQTAQFDDNQTLLLTRGIVYPCLAALEQRQIAKLEKKKASPGSDENVETSENPYANLGKKVLVKGVSGEFDQILTYDQLELIAAQEDLFHQQNLPQAEITKRLQEYIAKTFPGLNIVLDAQGKIQTFLGASGFSASGQSTAPAAPVASTTSFSELVREMKIRQGRQVQYDAIIASKGNLALTTENFQIKNANGITTTLNGLTLTIDQAGQGNTAVFFLKDKQGVSARFNIDIAAQRNGEKPPLNIAIYQKPDEDNPANPKLKIGDDEKDKLQKPLLALYAQAQAPEKYETAGEKPKLLKPISAGKGAELEGTKPLPSGEGQGSPQLEATFKPTYLPAPMPLSLGFTPKPKPGEASFQGSAVINNPQAKRIMPKITGNKPIQAPSKKPAQLGGVPGGKPGEYSQENQQNITNEEEQTTEKPPSKKKMPALVKVMIITAVPTAMVILGGMAAASS